MRLTMSISGREGQFEVESPIIPEKSAEIYVSAGGVDGRFKVTSVEYQVVAHGPGNELQVHVTLST